MSIEDQGGPPLLSLGLLSGTTLAYEVLLTRLYAIIQWHHYAYMIISLALLGYGASGSFLTLATQRWRLEYAPAYTGNALAGALSMVGCFWLAQRVAFNPLELPWDPRQLGGLLAIYLLLAIPFFFVANCIGLSMLYCRPRLHQVYAADLAGAGLGAAAVTGVLFLATPGRTVSLLAATGLAAAAVGELELRPASRRGALLLAVGAALLAVAPGLGLRPAPYKGLSQALEVSGAHRLAQRSSPLGLIDVVASPRVPFRYAPGLSLSSPAEPPAQLGVYTDAGGFTPITRFDGRRESLAYLDYQSAALPYHLLHAPRILVLGAGGGTEVLRALYHRAARIDAVELNRQIADLVRERFNDFAGGLYHLPQVHLHIREARAFLAATRARYDLIQVPPLDDYGTSSAGLGALGEDRLYTVEALRAYLRHLRPGGILALGRWVKLPPRDTLKLVATARRAMAAEGTAEPARHLVLVRSWRTSTLLVLARPVTAADITTLRGFCRKRSFDLAYYPGIGAGEVNRYNLLDAPHFYEGAVALLGAGAERFLAGYKFDIRPATDDRPYFFQFFRWSALPEMLRLRGGGGLPLVEWGYPVLVATLVQALLASLLLIVLPLWLGRRGTERPLDAPSRLAVLVYFAALGLGFMFLEIALLQRMSLFLTHPLYALALVLATFLTGAGLGSQAAGRLGARFGTGATLGAAVAAITAVTVLYAGALPWLAERAAGLTAGLKVLLAIPLIGTLAVGLGMPFPLGLSALGERAPGWVPWAWAINGCASVVGAVLAALLAIHLGFTALLLGALLPYWAAALSGARLLRPGVQRPR